MALIIELGVCPTAQCGKQAIATIETKKLLGCGNSSLATLSWHTLVYVILTMWVLGQLPRTNGGLIRFWLLCISIFFPDVCRAIGVSLAYRELFWNFVYEKAEG